MASCGEVAEICVDHGGDNGVEICGGVADDVDGGFGVGESAGYKAVMGLESGSEGFEKRGRHGVVLDILDGFSKIEIQAAVQDEGVIDQIRKAVGNSRQDI